MKLNRRNFLTRGSTALAAAGGTLALGADERPVAPPVLNGDAQPRAASVFAYFGSYGLTEIPDGRVVLPYGGFHLPHKYPRFGRMGQVGLAAWKQERLVALEADDEGEFHTQSLLLSGDKLLLNFQSKPAGHIKVEIADTAGRSLDDCDPLIGDQHKAAVTWRGQSSLGMRSKGVVLRFHLRAAKLFSFEIK